MMSILFSFVLFITISISPAATYLLRQIRPSQLIPCRRELAPPYFNSSPAKCLVIGAHGLTHILGSQQGNDYDNNNKKNTNSNNVIIGHPNVSIEYCAGCRWLLRSSWLMQEILTTFEQEMEAVTLIPIKPPAPGGTFLISNNGNAVLWDRKVDGGFPEAKQLKQRVRDAIAPTKSLGHSENSFGNHDSDTSNDCIECEDARTEHERTINGSSKSTDQSPVAKIISPNVSITYCTKYSWLFRSAWMSQEILTAFQEEVNSVTLMPSRPLTQTREGQFIVRFDGKIILDKHKEDPFPDVEDLKYLIQDHIDGIVDQPTNEGLDIDSNEDDDDDDDDDKTAELRQYFGVM